MTAKSRSSSAGTRTTSPDAQPGDAKNSVGGDQEAVGRCQKPVGEKEKAHFQGRTRVRGAAGAHCGARRRAEDSCRPRSPILSSTRTGRGDQAAVDRIEADRSRAARGDARWDALDSIGEVRLPTSVTSRQANPAITPGKFTSPAAVSVCSSPRSFPTVHRSPAAPTTVQCAPAASSRIACRP